MANGCPDAVFVLWGGHQLLLGEATRAAARGGFSMKLEGIRVIDLSVFLPGPYFTLALADHGAEGIKIEPPGDGDPGRQIGLSDGPRRCSSAT